MQLPLLLLYLLPSALAQTDWSQPSHNDSQSLLWGTYRPNLYFGMRPRLPRSLMTGLMWFGVQDFQSFAKARHSCEQGDELKTYTWTEHDPRDGGVEILQDPLNNLELRIQLLKYPGQNGGSWAARIQGGPLDPSRECKNSLIFYAGLEGFGGLSLQTGGEDTADGLEGSVQLSGSTPELGSFEIRIEDGPSNSYVRRGKDWEDYISKSDKTHHLGLAVADGTIWQAKEYINRDIMQNVESVVASHGGQSATAADLPDPAFVLTLRDTVASGSNLFAFQKIFEGSFSFDVYYETSSLQQKFDADILTESMKAFSESYDSRFKTTFPGPYESSPSLLSFSKDITANLLGGIGYFYGPSLISRAVVHEWDDEDTFESDSANTGPTLAPPKGLLTATPSRSFFPRGFYWDEGFHLVHIGAWDNDLSLEILKSWIDLIDEDGWVGREQILGEEARSKVPPEFQVQYPTYANPPTLTMAVTAFIERLRELADPLSDQLELDSLGLGGGQLPLLTPGAPVQGSRLLKDHNLAQQYLTEIYPTIRRHYYWFKKTQRGQVKQWGRTAASRTEAYRWRGRSEKHVLTSGLDDYPRAIPPHVGELHLDLICWMGFFSRTMKDIAAYIGEEDDEAEFAKAERDIIANLDDLHWNEEDQMYCDASVDLEDESYHVCHRGYISIFPLLLGVLPSSSPHLGPILELIRDPEHLWSPYGIRSLSVSHPLFGRDENYWRGAIWMQMNYLALAALYKKYAAEAGPYQTLAQEIYSELRTNIINNVHKEYERTGYAWEQYDAVTGEGRRSHPFTGWTSLVTLIISETYTGF